MSSRRKILVGAGAITVLTAAGLIWALPEIVRRVALDQIPKAVARPVSIEDVDLNLFTGRFAIKGLRLGEREGPDPFVEFARLEGTLSYLSLLRSDLRLTELRLTGPRIRVVRTGSAEFNFSDLLALFGKADPKRPPSRWIATLERAVIEGGAILTVDRHLSPAQEWRLQDLILDASGLTTGPDSPPGRLRMGLRLDDTAINLRCDAIRLAPGVVSAQLALSGLDLARFRPYLPPDLPAVPESGTLSFTLKLAAERGPDGIQRAQASGEVQIDRLAVAQVEQSAPFLRIGRLAVGIKEADLLARATTLGHVELEGLDLRLARDRNGGIDVLQALQAWRERSAARAAAAAASEGGAGRIGESAASTPEAQVAPPPALRLERLVVRSSAVTLKDEAVSPAREWRIQDITVDGGGLSTAGEDPSGTLAVSTKLSSAPHGGKPAAVLVEATSLRLIPLAASARVSLEGFDLAQVAAYLPPALAASPRAGLLRVDLNVAAERQGEALTRVVASGTTRLAGLSLLQRDRPAPFLEIPALSVKIAEADLLAQSIRLASIELEGVDIKAVRDPEGRIDLLALAAPGTDSTAPPPRVSPAPRASPAPLSPSAPASSPAPGSAAKPWRLRLDRLALAKGNAVFEDQAASPPTTLAVTDFSVLVERVDWPAGARPATLTLAAGLPGGGRIEVKGSAVLDPLDADFTIATRDAPIEPYQAYFPFPARLSGLFSGDSRQRVTRDGGRLLIASQGTSWARNLEVRDTDATTPAVRIEQMEIRGIDFSWPNYALVERVTMTRPDIRVERAADGGIDLRRLFTVGKAPAAETPSEGETSSPAEKTPAASQQAAPVVTSEPPAAERPPGLLDTMALDFREIVIEEGHARFLDRTTKPPASQEISRLALTIRELSNAPGRRATLTAQAIVGTDAALDMRGEVSRLGDDLFADLVGELRDFTLASVNPYAESFLSWFIRRGKLAAKVHYRLERDRFTGTHDILVGNLQVAPAAQTDEVKKRLGLPLGLIVAVLKDHRGDITFSLPLSGNLSDKSFNWGETIWAGVKQVILKVLAAPFNAIGRLFTSGDKVEELVVQPVTFAAGSSVVGPEMERHVTKVGDFLRQSPYVRLEMIPVATARDADNLKGQEVTARIQKLQREKSIAEFPAAVRVYFREQLPGAEPPKAAEDQLAMLREREPVPSVRLQELLTRRLEATREALAKAEGIPATRLVAGEAKRLLDGSGEGRVEFSVTGEGSEE